MLLAFFRYCLIIALAAGQPALAGHHTLHAVHAAPAAAASAADGHHHAHPHDAGAAAEYAAAPGGHPGHDTGQCGACCATIAMQTAVTAAAAPEERPGPLASTPVAPDLPPALDPPRCS